MSGGTGTKDFLNALRIAGRLWGSHGDKITNAAQGRNFDDEVAGRNIGKRRTSNGTPVLRYVSECKDGSGEQEGKDRKGIINCLGIITYFLLL